MIHIRWHILHVYTHTYVYIKIQYILAPKWKVGFTNGVFNLRTGKYSPCCKLFLRLWQMTNFIHFVLFTDTVLHMWFEWHVKWHVKWRIILLFSCPTVFCPSTRPTASIAFAASASSVARLQPRRARQWAWYARAEQPTIAGATSRML